MKKEKLEEALNWVGKNCDNNAECTTCESELRKNGKCPLNNLFKSEFKDELDI